MFSLSNLMLGEVCSNNIMIQFYVGRELFSMGQSIG